MSFKADRMHVFEAISLLRPFDINVGKRRVGPINDGAYIMADVIEPQQPVFSYGIGSEPGYDAAMALAGHPVFMFDHTIDPPDLVSPLQNFVSEGIGTENDAELKTLATHFERYNPEGKRSILKMDVEGAEWGVLSSLPQSMYANFDQILLEVHGLDCLVDAPYRTKFVAAFTALNQQFTLFHVHGNNYVAAELVAGFPVCPVIELSYVRTSLVSRSANTTLYPSVLDRSNLDAYPDNLLWFYPFLPTPLGAEAFQAHAFRNYAIASLPGHYE